MHSVKLPSTYFSAPAFHRTFFIRPPWAVLEPPSPMKQDWAVYFPVPRTVTAALNRADKRSSGCVMGLAEGEAWGYSTLTRWVSYQRLQNIIFISSKKNTYIHKLLLNKKILDTTKTQSKCLDERVFAGKTSREKQWSIFTYVITWKANADGGSVFLLYWLL